MALNTTERLHTDFFVGVEVENTIMKGERTLFVVGIKSTDEIIKIAKRERLRHIYLGTSQSFNPDTIEAWDDWDRMIDKLLKSGLWVTLDFDVTCADWLTTYDWNEYHTFIPMISVKLPNIRNFNYNATLKLDDNTWGDTNPGVWCHSLTELQTKDAFTSWKDYVGDKKVEDTK